LASDTTRQLTFLGTADLQGHLEPSSSAIKLNGSEQKPQVVGGISRIASIIKEVKTTSNHPVVVLTSGDDLMGRYFHMFHGKAICSLFDIAGYSIFALGNHEFDLGPDILGEGLEQSSIAILCSDMDVRGTALESTCQRSLIKEYDDIRVGYFSLMTPEFTNITHAGDVSLRGTSSEIAREMVSALQLQGVDIIVAVTHIGADLDRKLAAEVDGIDLIFGGHSHEYLPQLETINNTLIVNGGEKGTAVVRLDVNLDKNRHILPQSANYSMIPVLESTPEDPETARQLEHFTDQLPATVVLGNTETEWHLDKESLRSGESSVADMINDLILEKFQVDLVLINSGTFRGKKIYPAGPVTDTMLHEVDEFNNNIYLLKIKGKYLREILEHSAASIGQGGFLQIAGARIAVQPTAPKQEIVQKNTQWHVARPGQQILTVQMYNSDGSYATLDPDKTYSVATSAYLASNGGDKYFWFKQYGTEQRNTYTSLYSIMAMKIGQTKNLSPPKLDGRIRFVTEKQ
jgi:5'-nucleotidase